MGQGGGYEVATTSLRIGEFDYRVCTLADRQQYADPEGDAERAGISSASWPLFGVIWPAGVALAQQMAVFPIEGKRILEIGCGLGLSSIVLQRRRADITATDHHPLAEEFLQRNATLNQLPEITFKLAPWEGPNPELGRFDLIIGGDLLYERDHPGLLAGFVALHAKPAAQIIVADPGRSHTGQFSSKMVAQGYVRSTPWAPFASGGLVANPGSLRGKILSFTRGLD
jgi:predicted nicotinamide N-methyase